MSKEMIISVNGREKKIAILDNGKVTEFYIERGEENSGIAGNIYKGRVQRVLPGMQSAFVAIGLERDAFLYVSDFFDEEEEIERIVMENKSKKVSPEDAKREANERIDRARIEREKQMESVQELVEPTSDTADPSAEADAETEEPRSPVRGRRGRRGRDELESRSGGRIRETDRSDDLIEVGSGGLIELDDSNFERIVDDEETGEMFKDAYMQEAIVDKVRAIEFEMESIDVAEVGSVMDSFDSSASQFERIADEDDAEPAPKPKKSAKATTGTRKKKTAADEGTDAEKAEKSAKAKKPAARKKAATTKSKSAKSVNKATGSDDMPDAEASVREPDDTAEMSVRRGGRGRRRGGRSKKESADQNAETNGDVESAESADAESAVGNGNESSEAPESVISEPIEAEESLPAEKDGQNERSEPAPRERGDNRRSGRDRGKSGRDRQSSRGDKNDRNDRDRGDRRDRPAQPTISDLLREGQEIIVQIAKEPIAKKGARITSHIALPGRFLVYMPTIEHLGVSRKIESSSERGRLRTLIQRIRQDEEIPSGGFIVRTAGIGISEEDLRQDARYLVRTWLDIKKTSEKVKSPAIVHQDLDLVQRLLRDQLSDDFTAIRCDSEEEYLRTVEFINRIQPKLVNRVKFYTREQPILDAYGVQEEIDKALKPRVWLKSGGYLVINQTEALVAIDVNTGKFVGKGNARLEDTITRTNMEAVDEIARQIRLRDLGGIIVLDLIDMEDRRNRHKVSQALQEALSTDRSPTKVLSFNDFGLIIMTRKRVKQSLERTMCAPCEYCEGAGWVKSPQTVCYEILAEARRLSKEVDDVRQTTLRLHPDVARTLRSSERFVLEEIEAYLGSVDLTADPHIHQAQFDFAFI
jgi:Rne/Rng family ribonuclease